MVKVEKKASGIDGPQLVITIECSHQIVDDCFMYYRMNAASLGKQLIMEQAGEAYEKYVREAAKDDGDTEYFNKEFGAVS